MCEDRTSLQLHITFLAPLPSVSNIVVAPYRPEVSNILASRCVERDVWNNPIIMALLLFETQENTGSAHRVLECLCFRDDDDLSHAKARKELVYLIVIA